MYIYYIIGATKHNINTIKQVEIYIRFFLYTDDISQHDVHTVSKNFCHGYYFMGFYDLQDLNVTLNGSDSIPSWSISLLR